MFSINDFLEYAGTTSTSIPTRPIRPCPTQQTGIELVPYSDRSFAIFGDTKPMQRQLQDLGGKFNRFLKRDGIATPGYIFSITRIDAVRKTFSI